MIRFATGLRVPVRVLGLRPELLLAICVADGACQKRGYDCIITSIVEGEHSANSLHYSGCAFDFYVHDMQGGRKQMIYDDIKEALGEDYDVVIEKTHIHVEYQPRRIA
jgi:hypothetical protein